MAERIKRALIAEEGSCHRVIGRTIDRSADELYIVSSLVILSRKIARSIAGGIITLVRRGKKSRARLQLQLDTRARSLFIFNVSACQFPGESFAR